MKATFIATLVATAIFLALNAHARATTIVFIWGPADIVIGADSKLTTREGVESELICKIGIERNVVWAAAGALTFNDDTSVAKFVSEEMNKNLGTQRILDNIVEEVSRKLSEVLTVIKATHTFDNAIKDRMYITIMFGYFDNGVVNIENDRIKLPEGAGPSDNLQIIRKHCPNLNDSSCTPSGMYFLGKDETIKAEMSSDPGIIQRLGLKGAIDHFIEEESRVHPDTVRGPAAIVHLSSNGVQWIERGKCDN